MASANDYLKRVATALAISLRNSNIYKGRDGALRLAREVGYCLNDFPPEEAYEAFRNSYNMVCVVGYDLKPPVSAKEWNEAVLSKLKERDMSG
jgi:hypothetical protein